MGCGGVAVEGGAACVSAFMQTLAVDLRTWGLGVQNGKRRAYLPGIF